MLWERLEATGYKFPERACHTSVDTPRGLVAIGGVGAAGRVLACDAYCLDEGAEWSLPEQSGLLPKEGALHHGCYHRGYVVLVGGVDDAGLQRRGLGRPTEVHILCLESWAWSRLPRSGVTPPLHSRSAMLVLGRMMYIIGGDSGSAAAHTNNVAALDLNICTSTTTTTLACEGLTEKVWTIGEVLGDPWAAAGHTVEAGALIGGLNRSDALAPVAFVLPDFDIKPATAGGRTSSGYSPDQKVKVPRWFKR